MWIAVRNGSSECVKKLVKYGADVPRLTRLTSNSALSMSLMGRDSELSREAYAAVIHPAVINRAVIHPAVINRAVIHPAVINRAHWWGYTPLHIALRKRRSVAIQVLVKSGADCATEGAMKIPFDIALPLCVVGGNAELIHRLIPRDDVVLLAYIN